jgi:hypothetical protein
MSSQTVLPSNSLCNLVRVWPRRPSGADRVHRQVSTDQALDVGRELNEREVRRQRERVERELVEQMVQAFFVPVEFEEAIDERDHVCSQVAVLGDRTGATPGQDL